MKKVSIFILFAALAAASSLAQQTGVQAPQLTLASAPVNQPSVTQQTVPANMLLISGGSFMMGSPVLEKERDDDEIQHLVTLAPFYMGKYPVTQKEYQEITGKNPSFFSGDNLPVERVDWLDAIEYCNKRSINEGLSPAYTRHGENVSWNRNANGYRLPTEAEWEYACRAGTVTIYNTGNAISTDQANFDGSMPYNHNPPGEKPKSTTVVGSFTANPWGLYDMHGNVWEWCWDWYDNYSIAIQTNPAGIASGDTRILRGGCWGSTAEFMRSANRSDSLPDDASRYIGFRIVRSQ